MSATTERRAWILGTTAPALVFLLVIAYLPIAYAVMLSFFKKTAFNPAMNWVGLANYARLLEDTRFQVSLWNTAFYTVASTLPILAVPLVLALALNRGRLKNLLRSVFFFPFTLSVVTVGLAWLWLLDPVVAKIRQHVFAAEKIHGDDTTVPVLANGKTDTGRLWTYVRDDRPFAGPDPPALDSRTKYNRATRTGFARLCQAL